MRNFGALLSAIFQTLTDPFRPKSMRGYDTASAPQSGRKVAICVGHSRSGDKGAMSTGGVSEWEYWQPIAYRIKEVLESLGIKAMIVDVYDGGSYGASMSWLGKHLAEWGATQAVELHFNAAGSDATGFEYLYWGRSKAGRQLAKALHDQHANEFPNARSRGIKGKSASDRGALFLRRTPCPAVICEPFFGSNHVEWSYYKDRVEHLSQMIARGIANS